jgi:hypothetical protein
MGTEKVFAFWESMNAMWWAAWMTPWSAAKIIEKGLAPLHRRTTANARRLSKRRKR